MSTLSLSLDKTKVVTGFCYGFAAPQLDRLKELVKTGNLYIKDEQITARTATLLNYLSQQFCYYKEEFDGKTAGSSISKERIEGLILHGEDFLSNFTVKGKMYKPFQRIRQLEIEQKLYTNKSDDEVILNTLGAACLNYLEEKILGSVQKHYADEVLSVNELFNFFSETRQFIAIFDEP